jgi:flavin-dependent dehydrogenase
LPLSTQRPTQPTGRVMLVGDAASLVNPMSGEGIYYALLSGMLAGTSARLGAGAGSAYKQALSAAMDDHIRATTLTVVAARSSRTVVKVGMAAAARSQRVFDTYIDVGVGGGRIPFPKPATALRMAADVLTHRDKRSRQQ